MRFSVAALLLIVLTPLQALGAETDPWARIAILPASAAPDLLRQCSRDTISDADSYWVPTRAEVASIERSLPGLLARPSVRSPRAPVSEYFRQYVGVVANGRRLVYASFFHESSFKHFQSSWRDRAVIMCDGGDHFWGIVFDVDSGI